MDECYCLQAPIHGLASHARAFASSPGAKYSIGNGRKPFAVNISASSFHCSSPMMAILSMYRSFLFWNVKSFHSPLLPTLEGYSQNEDAHLALFADDLGHMVLHGSEPPIP